jgi:hypothetical protein
MEREKKRKGEKISRAPMLGRRRRDECPRGSSARPAPHRTAPPLDGVWPAPAFPGGRAHRQRPEARARPERDASPGMPRRRCRPGSPCWPCAAAPDQS